MLQGVCPTGGEIGLMWYMGGKHRQSKAIVEELVRCADQNGLFPARCEATRYIEPFCGAMGVAEKALPALAKLGFTDFELYDVSEALITMWRAVIYGGWEPPEFVSEETYQHYKGIRDPSDPMTAYCGHAISFGGKWFRGYARHDKGGHNVEAIENSHAMQRDAVLRKADAIRPFSPVIEARDYAETRVSGCLLYLDAPYVGMEVHHNCGVLDGVSFWAWARMMAHENEVLVTEFVAPEEWEAVFSWGDTVVRHHSGSGGDGTCESIYRLKSRGVGCS